MSSPEEPRPVSVDFARVTNLIPLLEKDLSSLERSTETYWKNFLRFKVKFLSLFHSADDPEQPDPANPMNKAAEGLELSHLIQLYEQISDEDSTVNLLRRVEQNNERLRTACGLLNAYINHFQNRSLS